jgi:drug/metabolite transporter (DMT)-like permease
MSAPHGRSIRDAIPVAGLLLLSFLWSLDSLREEFAPSATALRMPPFAREAMSLALLTLVTAVLALIREAAWPKGRQIRDAALIGSGLFVAPAVFGALSNTTIPELARVALYSLTPVFAVAFEPYLGRLTESETKGSLLAALGCVIGTLAVFPFWIPRTFAVAGGFFMVILAVAAVAAANCRAVRLISDLPRSSTAAVAAITGGTAATVLALASWFVERASWSHPALSQELAWSAGVKLPALLLLFWLMRRMSAVRMTTRFVVAPLITNCVGLILLRPALDLRSGLGLLLIAVSSGWLLSAREEESQTAELPLHLNQN